ncbi:hypothetical protein Y1Q_0014887 [Alligator mississippiensis]|uniref:Uncharacterized protein n=1 Tax=Alligator mississippiensis TaxID=8496 RepID=A0A151LYP9_ALLMI|nr:hypothetical protein Y1Q_0014887 [Alligator mississippiensis]
MHPWLFYETWSMIVASKEYNRICSPEEWANTQHWNLRGRDAWPTGLYGCFALSQPQDKHHLKDPYILTGDGELQVFDFFQCQ